MFEFIKPYSTAFIWTVLAALLYMFWMHTRARADDRRSILAAFDSQQAFHSAGRALLFTSLAVIIFEFLALPILFTHLTPAADAGPQPTATAIPAPVVKTLRVVGPPQQQPAFGYGEWKVNNQQFWSDRALDVSVAPGQPVVACLVQQPDGRWKATAIGTSWNPPLCTSS